MDSKQIKRVPQKGWDAVNGYVRLIQSMFPDDNAYYNIVELIRHIIIMYYYIFIESNLLSNEEIGDNTTIITRK